MSADAAPGDLPGRDPRPLGIAIFLASLSTLIVATILGHLIVRFGADEWPPPGAPEPPHALWFSTALMLLSSLAVGRGLAGIRRGDRAALTGGLAVTCGLALGFLVSQGVAVAGMAGGTGEGARFSVSVLLLAFLHGAHVLGGLVPLGLVTARAAKGRYSREHHEGVRFLAVYWHFLDAAWLAMFVAIMV